MKKFLLGLLLTFLIATPVYGYSVVKGDTPFGLWGANWKTELAKYGISDPTKLPIGLEIDLEVNAEKDGKLGATPTPTSSASRKYVEAPDFYLYSPAVAADTTITLNTLKDIYGNVLTMTDLGTLGYGRIDPDSATISESITFSGITANSDGTYTLTGVKSTLAKYPYSQTSGLKRSHSINAIFRLTNTAAFYDGFANKDNNEIVDGYWTFTSPTTSIFYAFPTVSSSAYTGLPTSNGQLATKYYVDTVGAGGFTSVNVSTTRGLEVYGTSPETVGINASPTLGMAFDSNGALYQKVKTNGGVLTGSDGHYITTSSLVDAGIATSTPTAGMIPTMELIGFGNGASGTISIGSGTTTIDLGGQQFPVFNYQSITITGTGKIAFTNPHVKGSVITINVIGNVTMSSTADSVIDLRFLGSTVASTTGALDAADHTGGTIYSYSALYASPIYNKNTFLFGYPNVSAGTIGGNTGGRGAGGLIMRIGGNLAGNSTILATGESITTVVDCATAKKGGGSGGDVFIGYKGTYTGTITINNAGGKGQDGTYTGGSSGSFASGAGAGSSQGAGGASGSSCNQNGSAGATKAGGGGVGYCSSCSGAGTTYTGGAGGASDGGVIQKLF